VLLTILGTSQSYMYSTKINTPCCFLCSDFVKFFNRVSSDAVCRNRWNTVVCEKVAVL